jgi:spore coat polysaccharide biosynthesis protein SpsF
MQNKEQGMAMAFKTDQEKFWAGKFGDDYIERNQGDKLLASNLNMWVNMLKRCQNLKSCIEFGANIGMNLKALKLLHPDLELSGIEINSGAVSELKKYIPETNVFATSILDFEPVRMFDLSFIKGVLIHINPDELSKVYEKLVASCGRYLLVAEYYNPSPVSIPYRGHEDRLFKRDFAGEIMQQYPEMTLIDYGFNSRHDPVFPQDDITWFLMEKGE